MFQSGRGLRSAIAALASILLARVPAAADDCGSAATFLVSPRVPIASSGVRILAATDAGRIDDLVVTDEAGTPAPGDVTRLGGPPWSAALALASLPAGAYRVAALRDGAEVGCARFAVSSARGDTRPSRAAERGAWDRGTEALYSAWIEHLFDAPPDAPLAFDSLQQALTDPSRNLLHDHLGLGEDDAHGALGAPPDCADMPYMLRAYFAWKLGLPAAYRHCNRGSATQPPTCGPPTIVAPSGDQRSWLAHVAPPLMDAVQSGNARTALDDDATDFYPVPLTRAALRPGTIYADPYGHTLMIVHWVPQTAERSGMLLAVDAQPDNSVARKRFWEGTFLFADDVASAGPGFKAFRPLVARGGAPAVELSNARLSSASDDVAPAPYSDDQSGLDADEFYARVGRLIDPDGLAPVAAYDEMLDALVEQLTTRVDSVQRGEDWVRAHPPQTIAMPEGAAIFETTGPWEDFATPSRDLRVLIAMKVLLDLPDRLDRHPELYLLNGLPTSEARMLVEQRHADAVERRGITYVRTDGSEWHLTVADLLARREALEMAYDPNDCIEVRWGAEPGSDEYATCRRHAPAEQRARMEKYRAWFHEGQRPTR